MYIYMRDILIKSYFFNVKNYTVKYLLMLNYAYLISNFQSTKSGQNDILSGTVFFRVEKFGQPWGYEL